MNDEQAEFENKVRPLIEWMNNFHPHMQLVITNMGAEMLEGVRGFVTEEYLRD